MTEGGAPMVEQITAAQAAGLIRSGDSVYFGGSGGGHAVAEAVIDALRDRHAETRQPSALTLSSTVSIGDWATTGFNKLADPHLLKRVISGGFNNCPAIAKLAIADKIEAYTLPQGVLAQLCRDTAAGRPGLLTRTGLHTFIDPRHGGGRQSPRSTEDLVKLVEIDGEEFLLYRSFPIDVAVIRGTVADERGNISMEEEAFLGENFSLAAAAKLHGGIVIAQVQRTAAAGSLSGRDVVVPAALVDYVVVEQEQRQSYQTRYDPAFAGRMRVPDSAMQNLPFDIRKVMARRAAMELMPGAVVNLGFGVSNGISAVAAEEGFYRELTLTVEQGIIGGVPSAGKNAGSGINFDMMAAQPDQFDFYDGGGLDIAFLSFAEVDRHGNVNVSRYGDSVNGPGGFINISQGARKIVFSGTLTTDGLKIQPDGAGGVVLEKEGAVTKWLRQVQQVTFNGEFASRRGQQVVFVTDRAVFHLTPEGIVLSEVAPGLSVERDILGLIGFPVQLSPHLGAMDARLFRPEPMGLAADFRARLPAFRHRRVSSLHQEAS
jgi:propionate CoA-transferase